MNSMYAYTLCMYGCSLCMIACGFVSILFSFLATRMSLNQTITRSWIHEEGKLCRLHVPCVDQEVYTGIHPSVLTRASATAHLAYFQIMPRYGTTSYAILHSPWLIVFDSFSFCKAYHNLQSTKSTLGFFSVLNFWDMPWFSLSTVLSLFLSISLSLLLFPCFLFITVLFLRLLPLSTHIPSHQWLIPPAFRARWVGTWVWKVNYMVLTANGQVPFGNWIL